MKKNKLDYKEKWDFRYKNIPCEIVHWGVGYMNEGKGVWNSYVYIFKKDFPNSFERLLVKRIKNVFLGYYWDYSTLEDMFDFNGGITFYEVRRDQFSGKIKGVNVGNDYAHIWNEGKDYDEEIIASDLKNTVDHLLEFLEKEEK